MANWWTSYPWRVIQPNFREIDTKDFDEDRFLEELKSFSCNMVMLNAAGLMADYESELEDHPVSPYLDGFNMKRLVERCHEMGIKVIARTDFSKISEDVFNRHPDWAYRHADGSELNYNGYVQTCLLGGYQGGYMDEILKEMFAKIPFDGIYCNMGSANATTARRRSRPRPVWTFRPICARAIWQACAISVGSRRSPARRRSASRCC